MTYFNNKIFIRIISFVITVVLNLVLSLLLVYFAEQFYLIKMHKVLFILFFSVLLTAFLPIHLFVQTLIYNILKPSAYSDLYTQTIDLILNTQSFDDMLKHTFEQILTFMNVKRGALIFYYQEKDEFDIYYQKDKKKRIIRGANIDKNNVILKSIKSPDDILVRSKLDSFSERDSLIIKEIDTINFEILVPIYYLERFYGCIAIIDRRKFSDNEIRLFKIFAAKIAILYVNKFYFNEILKRKELEKEYELTSKIQKHFLPDSNCDIGKIHIRAFHETVSSLTREFYDIFISEKNIDEVRISAYRVHGDVKETSIFMPGVLAVLQSFIKLGYPASKTITKLKRLVKERDVLAGELIILHSSINQNGKFVCCYSGYPEPLIFRKNNRIAKLDGEGGLVKSITLEIKKGEIIIICCKMFHNIINENLSRYGEIIKSNSAFSLNDIKELIITYLNMDIKKAKQDGIFKDENEDKLLILIGMEVDS